jgi:hypothetical protein
MSTPDLPADRAEAKERIAEGEPKLAQSPDEPKPETATDPADDFNGPEETPPAHDDVDVALQDGKDTADGKGDDEVPPADFQSYADSSADEHGESN